MELLERDEPLAELDHYLAEARRGRGGMVFVVGEAGIGKTSLLRTFANRVRSEHDVWWGACDPLSTPQPLAPLRDIVEGNGLAVDLTAQPFDVYSSFLGLLRAEPARVVVVEDAHWADQATLDMLRYLGRRVGDTPALVLVTYRHDEVVGDHPLRLVAGDLAAVTDRIELAALTIDAVHQLASGSTLDTAELHRATGGNPFFVTEVLEGDDEIPMAVRDAVLARVSRLGRSARPVVDAVAVSPESLPVTTAMDMTGANAIDTELALNAGVLVSDGASLRFRHELARQAVYDAMGPADRVRLHEALIETLDPDDAALITHHALASGRADLVAVHAPVAAREAAARRSHIESAEFWTRAIDATRDADQKARLRMKRVNQLRLLDRRDEAEADATAATAHFRDRGMPDDLAEALRNLGRVLITGTRTREGDERVGEAVALLATSDNDELAVRTMLDHAFFAVLARNRRATLERTAAVAARARKAEIASAEREADLNLAWIELVCGDVDESLRSLVALGQDGNDATGAALGNMGSGLGEVRRYDQADGYLRRAIESCERHDEDLTAWYCHAWRARILFEQGSWEEAVDLAQPIVELETATYSIATAAGALGRARVRQGEADGVALLEGVLEANRGGYFQQLWPLAAGVAEHHWLRGDNGAARAHLGEWLVQAMATDTPWGRGEIAYWMHLAGGLGEVPDNLAVPFRLHIEGDYSAAAEAWVATGCPYEQALALSFGDTDQQLDSLRIFDELGAIPAGQRVRQQLRAAGVTSIPRGPRASTKQHPAGLTRRQVEVLEQVRSGRTNAEIAAELFISKRTVEHHISAIMTKLGVSRRIELIRSQT